MRAEKFKVKIQEKNASAFEVECIDYNQLLKRLAQKWNVKVIDIKIIKPFPISTNIDESKNIKHFNQLIQENQTITIISKPTQIIANSQESLKYVGVIYLSIFGLNQRFRLQIQKLYKENPSHLIAMTFQNLFKRLIYKENSEQSDAKQRKMLSDSWIIFFEDQVVSYPSKQASFLSFRKIFQCCFSTFNEEVNNHLAWDSFKMIWNSKDNSIKKTNNQSLYVSKRDQSDFKMKRVEKWMMECDLTIGNKHGTQLTLMDCIRSRLDLLVKRWDNRLGMSHAYEQQLANMEIIKLPQYLLVGCSPWSYATDRQLWDEDPLSEESIRNHVKTIPYTLDLKKFCCQDLKEYLQAGEKDLTKITQKFHKDWKIYNKCRNLDEQVKNIQNFKNQFPAWQKKRRNECLPTGLFRFVGGVYLLGEYLHPKNINHKHRCIGRLITYVQDQSPEGQLRWYRTENGQILKLEWRQYLAETLTCQSMEGAKITPLVLMFENVKAKYDSKYQSGKKPANENGNK